MAPLPLARELAGGKITAIVSSAAGDDAVPRVAAPQTTGGGQEGRWRRLGRLATSGGGALGHLASSAFLPEGYPNSCSSDYLSYQVWDSIQGLSSYVRGMLSSHAMLAGVGVGSAAATPIAAVFQFFVKDLAGMVGGIVFASCQGNGLGAYAKQWRLFADCMNDIGLTLELASPLLPGAFLLLACLGSVARAVTGVAGGATRMALTQHFATRRNAADIAAKEGSQETAVTLVGMVLGMGLVRLASGHPLLAWLTFWALTVLHVWANVRAMRCLCIASINQARLAPLLRHFLCTGEALTPAQVASQESLVPPPLLRLLRLLRLGGMAGATPLVAVAPQLQSLEPQLLPLVLARLQQEAERDSGRQYLSVAAPTARPAGFDAVVLLRSGATSADVLEGYCAAVLLAWSGQLGSTREASRQLPSKFWTAAAQAALADVQGWLGSDKKGGAHNSAAESGGSSYKAFMDALSKAGWALDRVVLMQGQARLAWGAADLRTD